MELCDIDLQNYMYGAKLEIRGLVDWSTAEEEGLRPFLIIAIMQQILCGLTFIHDHDEVHRDLAPQNGIHSKRQI